MSGVSPPENDAGREAAPQSSPYALEVSVGGAFERRHRLRQDKPTWAGRRPQASCPEYEYIHIPASKVRWHCRFEWDAREGRFRVTTGGAASVWVNAEDVGGQQTRLLNAGDVVITSGESRGPRCVRLTLVKCEG